MSQELQVPRKQVMLFPSGEEGSVPLQKLLYPRMMSIKYEGTFCMMYAGNLWSRQLKLIPNGFLQTRFKRILDYTLENNFVFFGELFSESTSFGNSQSILRSYSKDLDDVEFYCFDCLRRSDYDSSTGGFSYATRYNQYTRIILDKDFPYVHPVEQFNINSYEEALRFYKTALSLDHEGVVSRSEDAYYKHGRCTGSEANLYRHRESARADVRIVDILPAKILKEGVENPRLLNGRKGRTFLKEHYETSDIAGSVVVKFEGGPEFKCGLGKGFTNEARKKLLDTSSRVIGKIAEISYNPHQIKDVPRQAKLVCVRDDKEVADGWLDFTQSRK